VRSAHKLSFGRMAAVTAVTAVAGLALAGCSAGDLGSNGGSGGKTTIKFLVDNGTGTIATAKALITAFEKQNPKIKVSMETRPGGTDGDNLVKTRLATGSMDDVFEYNSGSLFQQIDPAKNLLPLTNESFMSKVQSSFKPVVTGGKDVYGVPWGPAFAGGVLYNIPVYKKLGLQIPKTWDQFIANSQKIKAAGGGVAPVEQTYQTDTWTSQLFVLADYANIAAAEPNFAKLYTQNKAKYATDPYAIKGFQYLQQVHQMGLLNKDFASSTNNDGLKAVATGTAAQYPMLTAVVSGIQQVAPKNVNDVGFFAVPGASASSNPATVWLPAGVYVPKTTTGSKLDAVKKFLAYLTTPGACDVQTKANTPTGPYLDSGCTLPSSVPPLTKDVVKYFDDNADTPALEFVSPVKGPNLEQICIAVGSGITSAQTGAKQYDDDVKKQAQQLGLPGW
jgi:raffinose/stachyose/melibiose transport system substrate-binding protein